MQCWSGEKYCLLIGQLLILSSHWSIIFTNTAFSLVNNTNAVFLLARMRDDNMKTMPGVTIEDMGYKMGLNGVDNAKLSFDNVRIPRENLLNKYRYGPIRTQ